MKRRIALNLGLVALIAAFLGADTLTQLAFKLAAEVVGDEPIGLTFLRIAAGSATVWVAAALYFLTYILWMLVLQRTPLSRAFPLTALSYVTVPAAAWLVFGETIGLKPLAGIALILAGVCLIGHEASDPKAGAAPTADVPTGPLPCAD